MNKTIFILITFLFPIGCATVQTNPTQQAIEAPKERHIENQCEAMVSQFNQGNFSSINEHFNKRIFKRNVLVGSDLSQSEKALFDTLAKITIVSAVKALQVSLSSFEQWHRVRETDSRSCAIHSDFSESGLVLIEFIMVEDKQKPGSYTIADWRNFAFNTFASEVVRGSLMGMLQVERMNISNQEKSELRNHLTRLLMATKNKTKDSAWTLYNDLPEALKENPIYLQHVIHSLSVDDPDFIPASKYYLENTEKQKLGLGISEYLLYKREYTLLYEIIDQLEQRLVKDSVFDLLRASIARIENDDKAFLTFMLSALDQSITYEDAYWAILNHQVEKGHFETAVLTLGILEETFGYTFSADAFASAEEYVFLTRSDAFKNWIQSR